MAKFAYNNSKHTTTEALPFYLYTGWHSRLNANLGKVSDRKPDVPEATARVAALLQLYDKLEQRWLEAVRTQAKYYNKKATLRQFKVGKKV